MKVSMAENACAICGLPSERRCSACGKANYCSPEHQKEDWKNHKLHCVLYKIVNDPKFGRHLIATRTISEGAIILIEKPLVTGPKLYNLPICLGCYKKVDGSYFCSKCGFPMCSELCQNVMISLHRDNECKIFSRKGSIPKKIENYDIPHPLYQSILPLRCLLLRESCLEKWSVLNSLEHHLEQRRRLSEVWAEYQVNIVNFLRAWHGLSESYTEDTVNRVIGFIEVNSFQIKTVKKIEFCGLFQLGGLMSHDCRPNTHHAFTPEGHLILRASVSIKKNEPITMSYVDPLAGTLERRHILEQSKYFPCDCARCTDSTEFGTFISGVKCTVCEKGYLLPQNPLSPSSPWICYGGARAEAHFSCAQLVPVEEINAKVELQRNNLAPLLSSDDAEFIESQLSLQAHNFHPNHFLLLPLRKHLLDLYTKSDARLHANSPSVIALSDLYRNNSVAEKLLDVYNVLDPGLTRGRGLLLRQLYANKTTIAILEKDGTTSGSTETIEKLKAEIQKIFELDNLIQESPQPFSSAN